jgi:hypothetical protein
MAKQCSYPQTIKSTLLLSFLSLLFESGKLIFVGFLASLIPSPRPKPHSLCPKIKASPSTF